MPVFQKTEQYQPNWFEQSGYKNITAKVQMTKNEELIQSLYYYFFITNYYYLKKTTWNAHYFHLIPSLCFSAIRIYFSSQAIQNTWEFILNMPYLFQHALKFHLEYICDRNCTV